MVHKICHVQATIIHIFKKCHTFKKDEGSSLLSESQNSTNFLENFQFTSL